MIKAVIFDLDGTLLDTLDDLHNAVNYTMTELNQDARTKKEVRSFLGDGIKKLLERSLTNKNLIEEALSIFLPYYDKNKAVLTKPYDNILTVVETLKTTYKVGIVSNKIDSGVKGLNEQMFNSLFEYAYGARTDLPLKPNPALLNLCISDMGLTTNEVIYVGDSEVDYQTAKNANVKFLAVGWGFRDEKYLLSLNPDYYVNTVEDILKIIKEEAEK